jgi:O-antigen ligase
VQSLTSGTSVSNLSRFGFQVAGFKMFLANPMLGVGLGQFGINVAAYLPDWVFASPETRPMITFPEAPWPTVYSLYGRISAELGIVGMVGWLAIWLGLAARLARQARAIAGPGSPLVTVYCPVIMNCFDVLASGIASDTFRTPMMWMALGLACGLVQRDETAVPRLSGIKAAAPEPAPAPYRFPQ